MLLGVGSDWVALVAFQSPSMKQNSGNVTHLFAISTWPRMVSETWQSCMAKNVNFGTPNQPMIQLNSVRKLSEVHIMKWDRKDKKGMKGNEIDLCRKIVLASSTAWLHSDVKWHPT